MPETLRTFIAVDVSEEIRVRAGEAISTLSRAPAQVKWVKPEDMHLTLNFLGDVDLREIHAVCRKAEAAAGKFPAFEVSVQGAGAFPNLDRPRVLWLGVSEGKKELQALFGELEEGLISLGFRPDRRHYQPHLTIGRVRGLIGTEELKKHLEQLHDFDAGDFFADEIIVYSSTLDEDGPTYEVISRYPLAKE